MSEIFAVESPKPQETPEATSPSDDAESLDSAVLCAEEQLSAELDALPSAERSPDLEQLRQQLRDCHRALSQYKSGQRVPAALKNQVRDALTHANRSSVLCETGEEKTHKTVLEEEYLVEKSHEYQAKHPHTLPPLLFHQPKHTARAVSAGWEAQPRAALHSMETIAVALFHDAAQPIATVANQTAKTLHAEGTAIKLGATMAYDALTGDTAALHRTTAIVHHAVEHRVAQVGHKLGTAGSIAGDAAKHAASLQGSALWGDLKRAGAGLYRDFIGDEVNNALDTLLPTLEAKGWGKLMAADGHENPFGIGHGHLTAVSIREGLERHGIGMKLGADGELDLHQLYADLAKVRDTLHAHVHQPGMRDAHDAAKTAANALHAHGVSAALTAHPHGMPTAPLSAVVAKPNPAKTPAHAH